MMDQLAVNCLEDGSPAQIDAEIDSLEVVAQVGQGADALSEALLDMRAANGETVRRTCYLSENDDRVYLPQAVLQELSTTIAGALPAQTADATPVGQAEESGPSMDAGTGPVRDESYYGQVDAYLQALSPIDLYCAEDPVEFSQFQSISWTNAGPREITTDGNGWRLSVDLTIESVMCGTHVLAVQESGGEYYIYLERESLNQVRALRPASPLEPTIDHAAVEDDIQRLSRTEVYDVDDLTVSRRYDQASWTNPSMREPLPSNDGWTFEASLSVNDLAVGDHELTVRMIDGEYRLCLASEDLIEIDERLAAAGLLSAS